MSDIKELTELVEKFVKERDWAQFHDPKDLAVSLNLEASELLEHFQWKSPEEFKDYLKESKDEVANELADVLYWTLLMSSYLGIDLKEAFLKKMEQNEQKYPISKAKGSSKKYTELEQ